MMLDLAARRADLTPRRPALHWRGQWSTYADLDERATRTAAYLAELGVQTGDRVAILAHNHPAHLDLFLATAKLGFVYAPFNTRLALPELRAYAAQLRPTVLLHDGTHAEQAAAIGGARVSLDEHEAHMGSGGDASGRAVAEAPPLTPESIQMILPTGGTTGLPKGAMLPYRQGVYNAINTVMSWGLRDDDCVIQATPCFHAAMNAFTVPLWHVGARVVLQHTFDPGEYLRLVEEQRCTVMFLVPTMFQMLIEHPDWDRADLSSVRWVIYGGASSPDRIRRALADRSFVLRQGYGLTEAGVNCFSITEEDARERPHSVGKPMLHERAVIRRPDGSPCEPGEVGELTLAGPHVFAGYFERPDATAEVLRDGWLWTGDLASVDADGFFELKGRRKELFVSGGENVFPAEVEAAIAEHPDVSECAVVGVPDERWGEVGLAVVVARAGATLTQDDLRSHLAGRLARFKVPKHFDFPAALPKSGAGKILKLDIRQAFEARHVQKEEA